MDVKVLNTKQQKKHPINSKKKKDIIRNVLATPYNRYWPVVAAEDVLCLNEVLNANLPRVKSENSIPWNVLKDIPRDKRKEFRKQYENKTENNNKCDGNVRQQLAFGINEVTKSLEKDQASCVLITSEVSPQLIVKHIIEMCVSRKVPILVVPDLKSIVKVKTGIFGTVLAVKSNSTSPNLILIERKVKEISGSYPAPKGNIVNSEDVVCLDVKEEKGTTKVSSDKETTFCYLHRSSNSERVFVPKKSIEAHEQKMFKTYQIDTSGNPDLSYTSDARKENNISYKSLVVKRLKGNKNRNKRKNENIKKNIL